MSLNPEQTTKLRGLVKAKLSEFGQYVDDQLTDYVVIMVTNNKSEKQMAEDLELFLDGIENSTNFSAWLHQTIRSLVAESKAQATANTSSYKKQTSKTRNTSTNQAESDEVAIQIEANEFNEDTHQQHQQANSEGRSGSAHHHHHQRHHQMSLGKTPPLLITKPIHSCIGAVIKRNDEEEETEPTGTTYDRTAAQRRRRRSSSSSPSPSRRLNRDSDSSSSRMSTTRRNSGSVAKPTKNILLRAVDDANRSVNTTSQKSQDETTSSSSSATKKSIADQKLEEIRARRKAEQDSNLSKRLSYPDENRPKRLRTTTTTTAPVFESEKINDDSTKPHQQRQVVRQIVERRSSNGTTTASVSVAATKRLGEEESADDEEEDDGIRIELNSTSKHQQQQQPAAAVTDTSRTNGDQQLSQDNGVISSDKPTKFIVTLAGVDESQFAKPVAGNNNKRGGLFDDQDEELIYEGDADFDMADEQAADQQLFTDSYRTGDEMMDQDYTMDQDGVGVGRHIGHVKKKPIRCTFWPNCEKGDQCPFLHPNKPCTVFPNCPFGAACHYIHPTCRYDGFCARPDCPFTHNVKKISGLVTSSTTPAPISSDGSMMQTNETITTQRTSSLSSSTAAPKITINKIQQPYYSLVNTSSISTTSTNPVVASSQETVSVQVAPGTVVAPNATSTIRPSFVPNTPNNRLPAATAGVPQQFNQYTLINRTNTVPTIPINCKYGSLCKNPKCMYTHTTLPPKSQLKWVAPSATATTQQQTTTMTTSPVKNATVTENPPPPPTSNVVDTITTTSFHQQSAAVNENIQ